VTPKTIASYGGPFADAEPVEDPTSEISATFDNRALEDTAQMTRTIPKARFTFVTRTSAGACTVRNVSTIFASGSGVTPTVTQSATGQYLVTFPTSASDGLGTTETISFVEAMGTVMSTTAGYVQCVEPTSNTFLVYVRDSTGAASDLAGSKPIRIVAF
jgi:hypothetical protein